MPEEPRVTILVVDDDEVKRYTITRILRKAGFEVLEATTGSEALRLQETRPDLIVLDINLPDIDGFEVCRRIKADPATAAIPVLHLSATYVQSQDRTHGLDSGADGYLTDVVDPNELIATVRSLLRVRKAEEAARRSALQWQATFDAISDGVALLDAEGRLVRGNRALGAILGRPPAELEGLTPGEFLPRGDGAPGPFALMRESGRREAIDLRSADRHLLVTADPIFDDAGAINGAVCIVSDVTQSRRAEAALRESEERFRLLVDGVKDYALFMTDADGVVASWNDGAARLLGHPDSQILGRNVSLIFTPEDIAAGAPEGERRTAAAEGRAEDERWHVRSDGSRFWSSGVVSPLRDEEGGLRGFAKVMRDSTERKNLEEELRRRADELAEADRRKDEFLAMLAHELRNPLAPIRNALELIRLDPGDAESVSRSRELAGRQVGHMARLIDDLLDVSRITRGKIQLRREPVDLVAAVSHAVETTRPVIDSLGHHLDVSVPEGPLTITGDPTRVEQVLANLLNNAAKYTEPGGHLAISAAREGDEAVLRVRDDGVGISEHMLARVFDLFAQADRTLARAQGGLGIGLTLVRSLVEMHGGRVAARSEGLGKGSEFIVRLPAPSRAPAGANRPAKGKGPSIPAGARLRVLVVDDHVDSATSLARVLTLWGHEVRLAHNGPEGIEAALKYEPDVILLDIGLPGVDGYQVAERLRERSGPHAPLLIALTGYGQDEDRKRARAVGFDHHFVKPVDLEDLQRLLAAPG